MMLNLALSRLCSLDVRYFLRRGRYTQTQWIIRDGISGLHKSFGMKHVVKLLDRITVILRIPLLHR